ncbi:putative F-box domain-containing protein [Helianthus anomalus]
MEKLPEELLSDILIRLPAKQLAQFRCVSKPMQSRSKVFGGPKLSTKLGPL